MTLLRALLLLYGIHAEPRIADTLTNAAKLHHADLALVGAIATKESRAMTAGSILTGALLRLPRSRCADDPAYLARARAARRARRPAPPCLDRDPDAQAQYTARLFGSVPRRAWARMLAGYVCGPAPACQATTGARYAREVLALRDAIHRELRRAP